MSPCYVIGVLDNAMQGLTPEVQEKIRQADQIIGATRTIKLFKNDFKEDVEIIDLSGNMMQLPDLIRNGLKNNRQIIVLAIGDPLCHGIGSFLINNLNKTQIAVLPNISIMQLAFAHLGEAWQDVKICSVHNKDSGEWIVYSGAQYNSHSNFNHALYDLLYAVRHNNLLAVYTSAENSVQRIARMLLAEGLAENYELSVFEHLLQEGEKISLNQDATTVAKGNYACLNLLIIKRKKNHKNRLLLGYPDNFYAQIENGKSHITRRDIRAVVLAKMQLSCYSIVWDIGAGCGSVGLEAASICPQGYVHAIEKNIAELPLIAQNKQNMQLINYSAVCAQAPDKMNDWSAPDAVFIGGSTGQLKVLIQLVIKRLKADGTLVMAFSCLERLNEAVEILKVLNVQWEITQIQASHSNTALGKHCLQADNPVWIVSVSMNNNNI